MGETTKKTVKRHFFRGVVSEFKKVVWPDKNSVLKPAPPRTRNPEIRLP